MKKQSYEITKLIAISTFVVFLLLIGAAVAIALKGESTPTGAAQGSPTPSPTPLLSSAPTTEPDIETAVTQTAVFLSIDRSASSLRFYDAETASYFTLNYTGATDIRDKYAQVISALQLVAGQLVDLTYDRESERLDRLSLNAEAWEYKSIPLPAYLTAYQGISIEDKNYRCSAQLPVLAGETLTEFSALLPIDTVTVRGIGDRAYIMLLTNGHGELLLMGHQDFIGGTLCIDDGEEIEVTENTSVLVAEGSHTAMILKDNYVGIETITIPRGETIVFDVSAYGTQPVETGKVYFQVFPEYAELFVDGKAVSYEFGVELTYGTHTVEAALGGYTTWTGSVDVNSPDSSLLIYLNESTPSPMPSPSATPIPDDDTEHTQNGDSTNQTDDSDDSDSTTDASDNDPGELVDGNTEPTDPDGSDDLDETDEADDDADDADGPDTSTADGNLTIYWYPNADVYVDAVFSGTTNASGALTIDALSGEHTLRLTTGAVNRTYILDLTYDTKTITLPQ